MLVKRVNESMEGDRVGACCQSGGEMLPGVKALTVGVLGDIQVVEVKYLNTVECV